MEALYGLFSLHPSSTTMPAQVHGQIINVSFPIFSLKTFMCPKTLKG